MKLEDLKPYSVKFDIDKDIKIKVEYSPKNNFLNIDTECKLKELFLNFIEKYSLVNIKLYKNNLQEVQEMFEESFTKITTNSILLELFIEKHEKL